MQVHMIKYTKRKEILKLYESILTGSSKCHATGNEKDASGGWYIF